MSKIVITGGLTPEQAESLGLHGIAKALRENQNAERFCACTCEWCDFPPVDPACPVHGDAAQHGVQPTASDAEIDAATDEIIRRGEDELKRRGG